VCRYQVGLVFRGNTGAGDGYLPVDCTLLDELVQLASTPAPQELYEVGLGHAAAVIQYLQGCCHFPTQGILVDISSRSGKDARPYARLESGGEHQGKGGEEGAAIVAAHPPAQLQVVWAQQWRGFNGLEDVAGSKVGTAGNELYYYGLEDLRAKGDPDKLAGLHGETGRYAVGEGAGVAHRRINGHVRVVEVIHRTSAL
jgi:hypothetical protein